MLNWLCELLDTEPTYKKDRLYNLFLAAIKKKYTEGTDHRLPFLIKHLAKYSKTKWKRDASEGRNSFIYNNLVEITIAQLYWFTSSRPCEILPQSTKTTRGVKFKHLKWVKDKENNVNLLRIQIESYKNQKSKKIFKTISISTTHCKRRHKKRCICRYLNPYVMIQKLIHDRAQLVIALQDELQLNKGLSNKKTKDLKLRIKNLKISPENYLFVYDNGKPARTGKLNKIANDLVKINKMNEANRYKPYSFRIGGTTRASMVGIDHTVILKYVGWQNSRLADCAQRYMRYPEYMLSKVPFEMLHGTCEDSNYRRKKPNKLTWKIYDPWSEKTDLSFYK